VNGLEASVSLGEAGIVVELSGAADLRSAAQLGEVLTSEVAGEARHLTIEASGLSFVDSAAARLLMMTARLLRERGGNLTVAHPQPAVRKTLDLIGLSEMIEVTG
jgi:anti-anti-sigma factor